MRKIFFIILSLIFITSCSNNNDNIVINRDFENHEWSRFDFLEGTINVEKVPVKYDIVMEIMVSEIYPNTYENHREDSSFSFNMTIKNPNGSGARSKDYNYNLKDKDGNWKSEKQGEYYIFKLPLITEMTLGEEGIYNIKIENKFPKDPLQGIKSLTLKYNQSK